MSGKRRSTVSRRNKRIRFLPRLEALEVRSLMDGNPLQLAPIGVLPLADGAEISAYDEDSQRLFVTGDSLHIVDLTDPQNPVEMRTVEIGEATSVAVHDGLVAVAVPADPATDPGRIVFLDTDGTLLNQVHVGALPDMLTFTPDGQKLLVANEGEPDGALDPAGSVSLIDLSGGVANATVTTAGFAAFDGHENELRNQGIRIFPGKSVSQDVEPEYIAVAPDGKTAFVTLQEANAFGVLDLASGKIKEILPLGLKDHSVGPATLEQFGLTDLPDLGTTATGQVVKLGGLSGLWYDGLTAGGNYKFLSLADRGPNADPTPAGERPFLLPDYQARVVELELNPTTGQVAITNQILLTRADGTTPISGLPNIPGVDEAPVDGLGNPLTYDPFGADLEGIVRAPDGTLWMCDEYRPSIYHFDATGKLLARYVPQGTGDLGGQAAGAYGSETLPAEYSKRVANRGFEGIAYDTDKNLVYAFIQSPLANPDEATSNASSVLRMLGVDPGTGEPVTEYVYLLEAPAVRTSKVDKIGDAVYAGDGKFVVIERDSGTTPESKKFVFEIDLKGATNLLDSSRYDPYFLGGGSGGYSGSFATDSASAATAIATGSKTDDGNLAWLPGDPVGGELTTIAERLRDDKGFAIGVVSTVPFSHATPAAFASHNVKRSNTWNIAHEMLFEVQPEVVIGGGLDSYFAKALKDQTGADQDRNDNGLNDDYDAFRAGTHGTDYLFVERAAGVDGGSSLATAAAGVSLASGEKLFGLFGTAGGNFEYHQVLDSPGAPRVTPGAVEDPTLAEAVDASLGVLGQDDDGFFVMFEQGDIDWSNHANDFENMVGGVWDLDQAVRAAASRVDSGMAGMDWSDTLIIVTSDHSNSYMRLQDPLGAGDLPAQLDAGGEWTYPDGAVTYGSSGHTNELVTLSARGAGAELLAQYAGTWYPGTQIVDNSQIYQAMMRAADEAGAKHVMLFIGDGMNIEHELAASRYLYGQDLALAWHDWGRQPDGWAGFCSTWDVTTYNKYASSLGQSSYSVSDFDPQVGYDPDLGGIAPYPLVKTGNTISYTTSGLDNYFLPGSGGGYGSGPATDSASAGTAIATGVKTDDGNLAWLSGDPPGGALETIAETLRDEAGFAIGVVSTVPFSHATPAAFVSHNVKRSNTWNIAHEILFEVQPEVVIGGGLDSYFAKALKDQTGADKDQNDNGWNDDYDAFRAGTHGTPYEFVERAGGVDGGNALAAAAAGVSLADGDKLFGLFGTVGGNFEYHQVADTPGTPAVTPGAVEDPTLADTVSVTLPLLGQDPDGFFVMFEQGDIDWSNHANDFENMVGGLWDLDQAVRAAELAVESGVGGMNWSNTLMIVTSDHSNSYLRNQRVLGAGNLPAQVASAGSFTYPDGSVRYGTGGHTNELVTLSARGAGAGQFEQHAGTWYPGTDIVDNSQIYDVMRQAALEGGARHVLLFIGDGMNIEHEIAGSRYLYGTDYGLAWNVWSQQDDGWAGFCATWDVTTYNKYAGAMGKPAYSPTDFDPRVGYDATRGGAKPFPLAQGDGILAYSRGDLDDYYLPGSDGGYGSGPATDSASAGTAIATGLKTDDGNLAWRAGDPPGGQIETIAETLRDDNGFAIGVVSTVPFSHATPAAFVSHNVKRSNTWNIAHEILFAVQPEVVIGGGLDSYFAQAVKDQTGADKDLNDNGLNDDYDAFRAGTHGTDYVFVERAAGQNGGVVLAAAAQGVTFADGEKLFGLFGTAEGSFEYHQASDSPGSPAIAQGAVEDPTLADAVSLTLPLLGQDQDGFFVMFEQGDIDWSNHANDFENMIGGLWDLDQAVRAAELAVDGGVGGMDWSNTLMIVTADHSNSYLRQQRVLGAGNLPQQVGAPYAFSYPDGEVSYSTSGHTNEPVTLSARGRGAGLFNEYAGLWYPGTDIVDNTQIYEVMRRAVQELGAQHVILFIGDGMNIEHEIAGSRYLYGGDLELAWHDWGVRQDGWASFCSTWDVSAYNKLARAQGAPLYNAASFDPTVGYDPARGGDQSLPLVRVGEYMPLTGKTLEQHTADQLAALNIRPVAKTKVLNLPSLGYLPNDKPEGLAVLPGGRLAVLNDNDFALAGPVPISLGVIRFAAGNTLDASDRDGPAINLANWPVYGTYMPDAVASFASGGQTFYITANEGDDRGETERVKELKLDAGVFPNAADLKKDARIGRLNVSQNEGDLDGDGDYDQLWAYGGRSFSIWDAYGNLVFDSGDQLEASTAAQTPDLFNADDGNPADFDTRSDNKGPEPEAVTVGVIDGRTYAFVGIERSGGGVFVYDVTEPLAPQFMQYVRLDGDVGPESLTFIAAASSPTGRPLLAVANEVSHTVTLYEIADPAPDVQTGGRFGGNVTVRRQNYTSGGRQFSDLQVVDDRSGEILLDQPLAAMTSLHLVGSALGRDLFTVDLAFGGNFALAGGLHLGAANWRWTRDAVRIRGTANADEFALRGATGQANGLDVTWNGVADLTLEGGAGDDTYRFQSSVATVTVQDTAGTDLLDFAAVAGGVHVDLSRPNGGLQFMPWRNWLTLRGTLENVIGTDSADWIRGNVADNHIWGRGGSDSIFGNSGHDWLWGGAGDDWLWGDGGNDVLIGEAGADRIWGGFDRDLLLGGLGADWLFGSSQDDLLIAGTTAYDSDAEALAAILAEWAAPRPAAVRVANLQAGVGAGGSVKLVKGQTVGDDGSQDWLWGEAGDDWLLFFGGDLVFGRGPGDL